MHIIIAEQAGQILTFTGHLIARDEETIMLRLACPPAGEAPIVRVATAAILHEEQTAA
jgi:hypothetical protein